MGSSMFKDVNWKKKRKTFKEKSHLTKLCLDAESLESILIVIRRVQRYCPSVKKLDE